MDENAKLLCFTNGVFNYDTLTFCDGKPEDMSSLSTNIKLKPLSEDDEHNIEDVIRRFIYKPLGRGVGDNFLLSIFQALVGMRLKRIEVGLGGTNWSELTITTACLRSFWLTEIQVKTKRKL